MFAPKCRIILASKSPRRQQLLRELGLKFLVETREVEEVWPAGLKDNTEVAIYLCKLKSDAFVGSIPDNTVLITADTIVCVDDRILGKPHDREDAIRILSLLSGKRHEVITGVCLRSKNKTETFAVSTYVYFKVLQRAEIEHYLDHYRPYDKAGAYGIQEWIGLIGIDRIEGSYFNVMGLPVKELYEHLLVF